MGDLGTPSPVAVGGGEEGETGILADRNSGVEVAATTGGTHDLEAGARIGKAPALLLDGSLGLITPAGAGVDDPVGIGGDAAWSFSAGRLTVKLAARCLVLFSRPACKEVLAESACGFSVGAADEAEDATGRTREKLCTRCCGLTSRAAAWDRTRPGAFGDQTTAPGASAVGGAPGRGGGPCGRKGS